MSAAADAGHDDIPGTFMLRFVPLPSRLTRRAFAPAGPPIQTVHTAVPTQVERGAAAKTDRVFLEGPHSRRKELWLALRAVRDFIEGFRTLHFVGPCVTVFGSARYDDAHPYYALGREVGRAIVELGFTVMTGGGPGLKIGRAHV